MKRIVLLAMAASLAPGALGDDQLTKEIHTIENYCAPALKANLLDRTQDGQCAQPIFNGDPLHFNAQVFASGNGTGVGIQAPVHLRIELAEQLGFGRNGIGPARLGRSFRGAVR